MISDSNFYISIFVTILGAIGLFWNKIKSTIEKVLMNKKEIAIEKIKYQQTNDVYIRELENKLKILEQEYIRLDATLKSLIPLLTKILNKYPEFQYLIEAFENIIHKNK